MLALWHITFVEKGLQAVLRPKTPDYSAPGENVEINRISLAPTINECIKGLGNENDFNTKERKIYAYKILVEEGDESLYDSNYLYYNDLVKDALLTHEYWYTKIICPQEVLMCEVSSVEKRKYIIIGNDQTKKLKDILFKFNYTETIPSTISAFEIVNYLLDEKTVELVKSDLQHEVVDYTKDDQSYIIYTINFLLRWNLQQLMRLKMPLMRIKIIFLGGSLEFGDNIVIHQRLMSKSQ